MIVVTAGCIVIANEVTLILHVPPPPVGPITGSLKFLSKEKPAAQIILNFGDIKLNAETSYFCHSLKSQCANRTRRSDRLCRLNFLNTLCNRDLTVSGEILNRTAISRLVYPKQARAATSFSRDERDSQRVQSLSFDIYCVRPADRMSGINSDSGRPSSEASVARVT